MTGSPSGPVARIRTGALVPVTSVAAASDASSAATGRARTTTVAKLITLPDRAAILPSPGPTAHTRPFWSTSTTSGDIIIHSRGASASTVPLSSNTVAVTLAVSPTSRVRLAGSSSIRSGPAWTPARSSKNALVVIGRTPCIGVCDSSSERYHRFRRPRLCRRPRSLAIGDSRDDLVPPPEPFPRSGYAW